MEAGLFGVNWSEWGWGVIEGEGNVGIYTHGERQRRKMTSFSVTKCDNNAAWV